jgi:hypothetical protein
MQRGSFVCGLFTKPNQKNSLLGGYAALILKFVLRFWTPRYRANPRTFISKNLLHPRIFKSTHSDLMI